MPHWLILTLLRLGLGWPHRVPENSPTAQSLTNPNAGCFPAGYTVWGWRDQSGVLYFRLTGDLYRVPAPGQPPFPIPLLDQGDQEQQKQQERAGSQIREEAGL
jgi:hypothetical protein